MKEIIVAENAPAAIGPYSHAVVINDMVFTSGQLGLIPETGKLPEGVEAQTEQALINLRNVLKASGTDMEHVVKTTVFVQDLADFAKVNAVYAKFFATNPPARSCVQVAKLPAGGLVEIEAVAVK
ncbi:MAG: RidA family protein [Eubacteriales bacterium]|nr:RidA family protein [Clostridiales bacterium]MDY5732734.1 RidA family protein [Eubacteriales bacterium]